jgi:hypothetical protein
MKSTKNFLTACFEEVAPYGGYMALKYAGAVARSGRLYKKD